MAHEGAQIRPCPDGRYCAGMKGNRPGISGSLGISLYFPSIPSHKFTGAPASAAASPPAAATVDPPAAIINLQTSHSSLPVAISYVGATYSPEPNQLWGTLLPFTASPPAMSSLRPPALNATLSLTAENLKSEAMSMWLGMGTFPSKPEDSWDGGDGGLHSPTRK